LDLISSDTILTVFLVVAAVVAALFLALGDSNKPKDQEHSTVAARNERVRESVNEWARLMRREIDGMSCRHEQQLNDLASDSDVLMKDGKTEHLRCDQTGCATRVR
jgi:hypothetical protein